MNEENKIILYQDDNEITRVSVRYADEDLWLTQSQLSEIYQTSKSNVSEHIKHIFEDGELDKNVVVRNFRITTQHGAIEGKTQSRNVAHYNLDMVIALGYRVQSQIATRFRRWATQRLHEYIQKGTYSGAYPFTFRLPIKSWRMELSDMLSFKKQFVAMYGVLDIF